MPALCCHRKAFFFFFYAFVYLRVLWCMYTYTENVNSLPTLYLSLLGIFTINSMHTSMHDRKSRGEKRSKECWPRALASVLSVVCDAIMDGPDILACPTPPFCCRWVRLAARRDSSLSPDQTTSRRLAAFVCRGELCGVLQTVWYCYIRLCYTIITKVGPLRST